MITRKVKIIKLAPSCLNAARNNVVIIALELGIVVFAELVFDNVPNVAVLERFRIQCTKEDSKGYSPT